MWKKLCKFHGKKYDDVPEKTTEFKIRTDQKVFNLVEAKNLVLQLNKADEKVSDELLMTIIINELPVTKYKDTSCCRRAHMKYYTIYYTRSTSYCHETAREKKSKNCRGSRQKYRRKRF